MSAGLTDLLERMREHPSFPELLAKIESPGVKSYRPSKDGAETQTAEWIFRSGRRLQDAIWRNFLATWNPQSGDIETSQQENP